MDAMPDAESTVELFRYLGSLGVGGTIAAILFFFYRKDVRSYTDLWKIMSEQLLDVVKESAEASRSVAVALTQNTEVVKSLHRRLDKIERTDDTPNPAAHRRGSRET